MSAATSAPGGGTPSAERPGYPLRIEGELQPDLSRWLWLVKWLLAIPHYIVLFFLWIAFFVADRASPSSRSCSPAATRGGSSTSTSACCAGPGGSPSTPPARSAPTGTRPSPSSAADYPATLEVDYPERLSRGLVLVKWWLLAIPQYIIVAIFGSGLWGFSGWLAAGAAGARLGRVGELGRRPDRPARAHRRDRAAVHRALPADLFRLMMGLNRWSYRVLAYVSLMRDEYPPFRLDPGGRERGD